jgi:hypothetical protein
MLNCFLRLAGEKSVKTHILISMPGYSQFPFEEVICWIYKKKNLKKYPLATNYVYWQPTSLYGAPIKSRVLLYVLRLSW